MSFTKTFEIPTLQELKSYNERAIVSKYKGQWKAYSSSEVLEQIRHYAGMLQELGVQRGDLVVLIPEMGTAEWLFLDLAAQHIGIVVVLVHSTSSRQQFEYVLEETEPRLCFVRDYLGRERFFDQDDQRQNQVIEIYGNGENNLEELLAKSRPLASSTLEDIGMSIKAHDLSTIIYTSGTTGRPKGVMLSHHNIVSNLSATVPMLPLDNQSRVLSFLPYSHIFERTTIYSYLAVGASIYFPGKRSYIQQSYAEAKPHLFTSVPRIIEKLYQEALLYQSRQNWLGRKLIDWAVKSGVKYYNQKQFNLISWFKLLLTRMLIFRRFRKALGNNLVGIIVGAAHLKPELGKIFAAAGIKLREGYGMTEASPAIAVNRFAPGLNSFGTVGLPLPNVQVKIDDPDENGEGEILVKGPNVMQGYFKQEAETRKVLSSDGWLRTGDVGKFVRKRFLAITDRKKDIFKTSAGKYIAPQVLENIFRESELIDQLLIIGFQRPYLTALIYPEFSLLEEFAEAHNIHWTSPQYMALNIKIRERIQREIDLVNQQLPNHQRVRAFHLVHEEWSVEKGQLSNTLKIIRSKVMADFAKEIDAMYATDN